MTKAQERDVDHNLLPLVRDLTALVPLYAVQDLGNPPLESVGALAVDDFLPGGPADPGGGAERAPRLAGRCACT